MTTLTLTPTQRATFTAFQREVRDLLRSELLRSGALRATRVVVFIDVEGTGRLNSVASFPDEDALRGLVTRVRKFSLEQDPYHFGRVRSALAHIAREHSAEALGAMLKELKARFVSVQATGGPRQDWLGFTLQLGFFVPDSHDFEVVTPARALDAWLYGQVVHANDEQRARWDRAVGLRGVENIYRLAALHALVSWISIICLLFLLVEQVLADGELPDATSIARLQAEWEVRCGISLPSPGFGIVSPGLASRATVARLLAGEQLSIDEMIGDIFPPAPAAVAEEPGLPAAVASEPQDPAASRVESGHRDAPHVVTPSVGLAAGDEPRQQDQIRGEHDE